MTVDTVTVDIAEPGPTALVVAVRMGDLAGLARVLADQPELATARIRRRKGTLTSLHLVTDWPGYFPNGPAVATALLAAGADVHALTDGRGRPETPLHWAASTDDLDVAEVLVDGGADLDTRGGSIGTPLANAIGYGCWQVARLLVQRGATVDELWQAAALGMYRRVEELLAADAAAEDITHAFWQACHGGQRRVAELLKEHDADISAHPDYAQESAAEIAERPDTPRQLLATWLREQLGQAN